MGFFFVGGFRSELGTFSWLEDIGLSWAPFRLEDLGLSWAPFRLEALGLSWARSRLEDLGLSWAPLGWRLQV